MADFKDIVELIYQQMEGTDSNWQMPWHGKNPVPINIVHGRSYSGINRLLLWSRARESGFKSRHWGTFNQWRSVKQPIAYGSKAATLVVPRIEKNESGEEELKGFNRFWVFNGDQVLNRNEDHQDLFGFEVEEETDVEAFVANLDVDIRYGFEHARYLKLQDHIEMPNSKSFLPTKTSTATQNYYSTMLHEIIHWTGHEKRQNRKPYIDDSSLAYAFEELVAELGGSFLCSDFELEDVPRQDHSQYLNGWLSLFREKPAAFWKAATLAQQAVNYLKQSVPAEPEQDDSIPSWFTSEPVQVDMFAPGLLGTGKK
jgi:antirestriction protein ArdC